jgi:ABC-2 type transport system permease protein
MGGLVTITKKEFLDHISSNKFLILFGTLLIAIVVSAIQAANSYFQYAAEAEGIGELYGLNLALSGVVQHIMTIGAILAITISFDLVNGEKQNGSLQVLLSYPVYRDTVINGKFLGGLATLVLIAGTSLLAGLGIYVGLTGVPTTSDNIVRYSLFLVITVLFLTLFLSVGLLLSTVLKNPSSSLLGALLFWVISATLLPQITWTLAGIISPESFKVWGGEAYLISESRFNYLNRILGLISPSLNYQSTIEGILTENKLDYSNLEYVSRIKDKNLTTTVSPPIVAVNWAEAGLDVLPNIVFLLAATIFVFNFCYYRFTRQEVS